ncbi:hypothetical protein C5F52_03430 [Limnohabitans sp. TS-CS-82]|nr:hypothetical protein C5F52_03430 [Limnohabitans sp. TS-CS-82]
MTAIEHEGQVFAYTFDAHLVGCQAFAFEVILQFKAPASLGHHAYRLATLHHTHRLDVGAFGCFGIVFEEGVIVLGRIAKHRAGQTQHLSASMRLANCVVLSAPTSTQCSVRVRAKAVCSSCESPTKYMTNSKHLRANTFASKYIHRKQNPTPL